MIVQIYEIQTALEAWTLMDLGVDHIGSVLLKESRMHDPKIKEVVEAVRAGRVKSSLIPLFQRPDAVFRMLDYFRPDLVHFCEDLLLCGPDALKRLGSLQEAVRKRFPEVAVARTVPIPEKGKSAWQQVLKLAARFEPVSDYFLADTHIPRAPVEGFAGITGRPCDWDLAAALVRRSRIPVILAGGLGPENVFEAILRTRPAGVDSCTGTNDRDASGVPIRFRKDPSRVKRFVEEARRAEKALSDAKRAENTP